MFKNSKLTEQLQDMRISPQRLCNHTLNTDTCIPPGQRNTLTWPTKKADAVFLPASGRNQKLSRSSSCLSERKQNTSKKEHNSHKPVFSMVLFFPPHKPPVRFLWGCVRGHARFWTQNRISLLSQPHHVFLEKIWESDRAIHGRYLNVSSINSNYWAEELNESLIIISYWINELCIQIAVWGLGFNSQWSSGLRTLIRGVYRRDLLTLGFKWQQKHKMAAVRVQDVFAIFLYNRTTYRLNIHQSMICTQRVNSEFTYLRPGACFTYNREKIINQKQNNQQHLIFCNARFYSQQHPGLLGFNTAANS